MSFRFGYYLWTNNCTNNCVHQFLLTAFTFHEEKGAIHISQVINIVVSYFHSTEKIFQICNASHDGFHRAVCDTSSYYSPFDLLIFSYYSPVHSHFCSLILVLVTNNSHFFNIQLQLSKHLYLVFIPCSVKLCLFPENFLSVRLL